MKIDFDENPIINKMNAIKFDLNPKINISKISQDSEFLNIFRESIKKINTLEVQSEDISKKFELGYQNVGINDVMLEMQKAAIALNFGIQVTNKLVGAYQEIMNMNI
ncbi:flagellar basal-body component [Wigglesworthia glossinidia endosymbiont of Glossina morsitans morsitans (Yale colony)]|uniref:Flagellar hook-basal body complex protein FliE n=1 Tax=Wigglesworthia glossinidia endosymbiont of Glossina morsitans morsitans (Yale colony) TaxID=1142511 RepID=H6Q5M1_WIGGL|nr:flagellar hook-basal body complex protein FliE [Wigglesworthia glossinidia]AFA40925.1 flagellar basal-body component [Wigglesworthia glossinidia endosymbiont of Glossina morsitans morsitans (Yale colony)]